MQLTLKEEYSLPRQEIKFLITRATSQQLISALRPYVIMDENTASSSSYSILTHYFDTENLRSYWQRQEGVKTRSRLRLRKYLDSDQDEWFFELKQKITGLVSKRRLSAATQHAQELYESLSHSSRNNSFTRLTEKTLETPSTILYGEIQHLLATKGYRPTLLMLYERQAFVADSDVRITFDSNLCCHPQREFSPYSSAPTTRFVDEDTIILEIKIQNSVPLWLVDILDRFHLTKAKFSKYCAAIEQSASDLL